MNGGGRIWVGCEGVRGEGVEGGKNVERDVVYMYKIYIHKLKSPHLLTVTNDC